MEADTIIVGAGSAGAVLASRLSEAADQTVLLLEAGSDYGGRATTPADILDSRNLASMQHDWGYTAHASVGRHIPYRRGRVVGGTSAINAAAAVWGHPEDFAEWADAGNVNWAWSRVEPAYRRIETDQDFQGERHGSAGPVPIIRFAERDLIPIQDAFLKACIAEGLSSVEDHNETGSAGVGPWPMNRTGETRVSTALSHLEPARGRHNLLIRERCLVDRVLFDAARAVGVELAGEDREVFRARRIVLAAGAIGSPSILMRSGIGPRTELDRHRIPVRVDRAGVGARLWDHAAVPVRLVPKAGECVIGRDPRFQIVARLTASEPGIADDLMLVLVSHFDLGPLPALMAEAGVPTVAVLLVALMKPHGHGTLRLATANPEDQPDIDLDFCAHPNDVARLSTGVRRAWRILRQPIMARAITAISGLDEAIVASDERLVEYMRKNVGTFCHAMGTAPMGLSDNAESVVDAHCRVLGVEGLWIVDASVVPSALRVVPNLTIIMLADRIAEELLRAPRR